MSNHTPGPWLFDEESEAITTNDRVASSKTQIATVELGWAEPFESEQIANARLIAAAPELLAELITMTDAYTEAMKDAGVSHCPEAFVIVRSARAAIAKATEAKP